MDMRLIFLISFVISIIVFSYLARKLYQERGTERWMKVSHIILLVLGFLMLLNGFLFEESVMKIFGLASVSAAASLFLMHYIESENRVKRILEAIFSAISLGIITYGYFITRSLILGVTTLFIFVMFLVALILSHFLPKARSHIRLRKNG
ncbi:MAG: hypothetical protein QXN24_06100 [Candidatus Bathyarchaeia archaeon]